MQIFHPDTTPPDVVPLSPPPDTAETKHNRSTPHHEVWAAIDNMWQERLKSEERGGALKALQLSAVYMDDLLTDDSSVRALHCQS